MSESDSTEARVEYREIPGFPGYRVGNDGSVWSCLQCVAHGKRIPGSVYRKLKPGKSTWGYSQVSLRKDGKRYDRMVHRLVLEAFVGVRPSGYACAHNNGDRTDNRLDNLRWDTMKNNMADKKIHGTELYGESHPKSKLTNNDVISIRKEFLQGGVQKTQLAKKYNVTRSAIYYIVNKKVWNHLPESQDGN